MHWGGQPPIPAGLQLWAGAEEPQWQAVRRQPLDLLTPCIGRTAHLAYKVWHVASGTMMLAGRSGKESKAMLLYRAKMEPPGLYGHLPRTSTIPKCLFTFPASCLITLHAGGQGAAVSLR